MKTLDKYLIKSFLAPFISSFLIVMFVLVMQALWLAFDDIAGKGIGIEIIGKFLWYMCLFVAPQALPISVLLSSIMTLGSLGEHYEYAAIKSAGISYFRFLRPLLITVGIIATANFFMLNYTFPYASLKQKNLLLNIKKTQPTLALVEGSFNDEIPGYSIKFSKKYGEENNLLKDVLIIDTNGLKDDNTVITAKKGAISTEEGSKYMTLTLENGYYFQDHTNNLKTIQQKLEHPSSLAKFNKYTVNIDISSLSNNDLEDEKQKHHFTMKNMGQLKVSSDSLKVSYDKFIFNKFKNFRESINVKDLSKNTRLNYPIKEDILANFDKPTQKQILQDATYFAESQLRNVINYNEFIKEKRKELNNHDYQYHYIIISALSCLLLFVVGASLGSLIRKGGFGLPMVSAIILYVLFHFTNTFGKNLAEESSLTALIGGWLGTLIMGPMAIIFTYRALKDMGFINFDLITIPIKNIIRRFKKKDE